MSKWISGQELQERLKIKDFELFNDCVRKGLQPYNQAGQPISPSDVMERILDVKGLKEELVHHEGFSNQVLDEEEAHYRADRTIALGKEIEDSEKRRLAVKDIDWNEFKHPETEREARRIIAELVDSLFKMEDVEKFEKQYGLAGKIVKSPKQVSPPKKPTKEQRHKMACREVAKQFWPKEKITIADMILRDEIVKACDGKIYAEKTIRNWIKDLCPDRLPGRRPKKPAE